MGTVRDIDEMTKCRNPIEGNLTQARVKVEPQLKISSYINGPCKCLISRTIFTFLEMAKPNKSVVVNLSVVPPEYETEPVAGCIYHIKNGQIITDKELKVPLAVFQLSVSTFKQVTFPTQLVVTNKKEHLQQAAQIKKLIDEKHTAKAFVYDGCTMLAFGRTVADDKVYATKWTPAQNVHVPLAKKLELMDQIGT